MLHLSIQNVICQIQSVQVCCDLFFSCYYKNTFSFYLDLSRNRFIEFPRILCTFFSLERLNLYHNAIKSIPEQIVQIHMLKVLDLR